MAHTPAKPKRFRLNIVGPIEDVPRALRAYGRACGGEVALVHRPIDGASVLVHLPKDGAFTWRATDANDAPARPATSASAKDAVALIKQAQKNLPAEGPITLRGRWVGVLVCADDQPSIELRRKIATYGTLHVVSRPSEGWSWRFERAGKWFTKDGQTEGGPFPLLREAIGAGIQGAQGLVREACGFRDVHRRAAFDEPYAERRPIARPKAGRDPITRWDARRAGRQVPPASKAKTATRLSGEAKAHPGTASWSVAAKRVSGRWSYAVTGGGADQVLGTASDVRRLLAGAREEHDAAPLSSEESAPEALWLDAELLTGEAHEHPATSGWRVSPWIRRGTWGLCVRDAADQHQGWGETLASARDILLLAQREVDPPEALAEPEDAAPTDTAELIDLAGFVRDAGEELAKLADNDWLLAETHRPRDVAAWFDGVDLPAIAEAIRTHALGPDDTVEGFVAHVAAELEDDEDLVGDALPEARRQLLALRQSLATTPALLERARTLIRYALSTSRSDFCIGEDRRAVFADVMRAAEAYERARAAVLAGQWDESAREIRDIGNRLALAAARAAKACAAGQQGMFTSPSATRTPPTVSEAKQWVVRALGEQDVRVQRRDLRARTDRDAGVVRIAVATAAASVVDSLRAKAANEGIVLSVASTDDTQDPAKDALLLDAFKGALSAVLQGSAA